VSRICFFDTDGGVLISSVAKEITKGKKYNSETYNCGTFADEMVKKLMG
jgi:hypothetical protein